MDNVVNVFRFHFIFKLFNLNHLIFYIGYFIQAIIYDMDIS